MNVIDTDISGVKILEPRILGDSRGYFFESFRASDVDSLLGCHVEFVQENQSRSCRGVVRGLHFQLPPHAQAKLVRVVEGTVLDVAVDLRRNSPTYGRHVAVELPPAVHPPRLRPRLRRAQRFRHLHLQVRQLLRPPSRRRHPLERPRHRHRLAPAPR